MRNPLIRRPISLEQRLHFKRELWSDGQRFEIKSCANLAVARASMAEWGPAARIRAASGLWVSAGQFQWTSPGGDRKSAEYVRCKPTKDKEKMKGEKRSREEAAVSQRTKLRKCRQPARYTQRSQPAAAQASTAAAGAHGRPPAPYARVDLRSAQPDAGTGHGIDLGLTTAVAISLPRSMDRRMNIRATMGQLGAPMVVTAAVDGAAVVQRSVRMKRGMFRVHLTAEGRSKLGISTARVATTVAENVPGVFGCTRSHMRALEKVKHIQPDGRGYALVVEDDAVLGLEKEPWKNVALPVEGARFEAAAVRRIVKNLTGNLDEAPGIIWLGASDGWPDRTSGAPVVLSTYRYKGRTYELKTASGCCLSHAYLVSPSAIPLLVRRLEKGMAADGAIAAATAQGEITGARFYVNKKRCNFLMQASTRTWAKGSSIRGKEAQQAGAALNAA